MTDVYDEIEEQETEKELPEVVTFSSRLLGPVEWTVDPKESSIGPGRYPGLRRPIRTLWWLIQVLLGVGFLLPLLAGLAAIPGLSFVALGMMLEAQASVGKTGRLRDGFPLLAISTRVATIGLMTLLFLTPVMLSSSVAEGQQIVARISGLPQRSWAVGTVLLQILAFVFLLLAIANGGSFGRYVWPFRKSPTRKVGCILAFLALVLFVVALNQPGFFVVYLGLFLIGAGIRNALDLKAGIRSGQFVESVNYWSQELLNLFRPWHHFKLAIKAAAGALCWLVIPTLLLGAASSSPHENETPAGIVSFIGGGLMIPVAAWLPLLQCHQVSTGRFRAIFEVRVAREIIRRVPIRWAVATILLYGLAIPLYLSKIVLPPADAFWLFTPLFILVIYPTRILMAWQSLPS